MPCILRRIWHNLLLAGLLAAAIHAQAALTWPRIKQRVETANPTLKAGQIGIDENRAQEITAFLRPNPDFTVTGDQIDPFTFHPFRPFYNALLFGSVSYLHERQHKRELRLGSAQSELERTLLFSLRSSFVQTLQAKAVLALSRESLNLIGSYLTAGSQLDLAVGREVIQ